MWLSLQYVNIQTYILSYIYQANKNDEVSFKDFNEVLKQEQVVNPSLSRKVDQWMKEHSDVQRKNHGNGDMESKTMSYIEKAYNLGFIDMNGSLYRAKT